MAAQLTVIQGSFGESKQDAIDNAKCIAELEAWLQRAKDRKIVSFAIAAIAADGCALTQAVPKVPSNVFALYGATHYVAERIRDEQIVK